MLYGYTGKGEEMSDCICKGTWRKIVAEYEPLIGKTFVDHRGNEFVFFGLVHSDDDYYYGMHGKAGLQLLSCVGSIEGHEFTLKAQSCSTNGA